VAEPGERAVVVAGDRNVTGHVDPGAAQRVEQTDRDAVVRRDHRGGQSALDEQVLGRRHARLLGEVTVDDRNGFAEPVPAHRAQIPVASIGPDRARAARRMHDPAVPESDEVIDGGGDAA